LVVADLPAIAASPYLAWLLLIVACDCC